METLKKRTEFLTVSNSGKHVITKGFVLQAYNNQSCNASHNRIGFTVSKKNGGAVIRNRIKRRLRATVEKCEENFLAWNGFDYVLVGRKNAFSMPLDALANDLKYAINKAHKN